MGWAERGSGLTNASNPQAATLYKGILSLIGWAYKRLMFRWQGDLATKQFGRSNRIQVRGIVKRLTQARSGWGVAESLANGWADEQIHGGQQSCCGGLERAL